MRISGVDVQYKKIVRKVTHAGEKPANGDYIIVWGTLSRLNGRKLVITGSHLPYLRGVECEIAGSNYLPHWNDAIAEFILRVV